MAAEPPIPQDGQTEPQFVHLHVHTEYSLLDGLSKIDKLVARAQALGMPSLAISDHGVMHGVIAFYKACMDKGIKPIIGMEGYLAKNNMRAHDPSEKQPYHLLLLARNEVGYRNLLKIASASQLEGFYQRPRIDKDFLAAHAEGLIGTSGCLAAEIPRMVVDGREDEARRLIGWYQDVFGKDNFFLELQAHDIPELHALNRWLYDNRQYANVPLLATNDVHYVLAEDFDAHDTLLCIQTNALKSDERRMRMSDPSYHLRSPREMWALFGEVPEALTNTLLVAEMVEPYSLDRKGYHLPVFPVPSGYTAETYLRALAEHGLQWRYGARAAQVRERLDYELGVIHRMGFDTYFLIVWDLCQFARHADIWWNVRGSAAGSVTAYCLGITNIDPLPNNLIFERFLNPGRVTMPDIDMDFPDDRRMEMIEYAMRKYGSEKVAAIITFGTLKARAAIKDVGRVLDVPLPRVNELTALVPNIPSRPVTLAECLGDDPEKAVPQLKEKYHADPMNRVLLDTAMTVEGVARNAGTHAAGVVIADRPLSEYIPLHRPIGETRLAQVTQFDMNTVESVGLLKVDFLGLSTLTIMRKACELIERYHGVHLTMDNIPYRPDPNDPEVTRRVEKLFDLIGRGDTTGVFQLESSGMKKMLTEMKPRTFEHIIAAISLYRPGPMELIPTYIRRMHGEEEVRYHHEKLIPILEETYAIVVYQEQIQQIAAQLFGYSLADADLMRRAVSKKKKKDLDQHKAIFMERGPKNGVSPEIAAKIFDEIEYFASYGFNKSHAADYAVLTCQTAYLKAHYPEEYYTALLSVQRHNIQDVSLFINDCRRLGIPVLPPDVNGSDLDFVIEPQPNGRRGIRYGLSAVKNVGEKVVEQIIAARREGGPFRNLPDFARRVDLKLVGRRPLEMLAKVGAFDTLVGGDPDSARDVALAAVDRMVKFSEKYHEAKAKGQISLFGGEESFDLPDVPPNKRSTPQDKRAWEKELVGLYISSNPLQGIEAALEFLPNFVYTNDLHNEPDSYHGKPVTVVGLVVSKRLLYDKKHDEMAVLTLEDNFGTIGCVLFPRTWARHKDNIHDDKVIAVMGKGDSSRGEMQVIADRVETNLQVISYRNGDGNGGGNGPAPAYTHIPPRALTDDDLLDSREYGEDDGGPEPEMEQAAAQQRFVALDIDDTQVGEDGLPASLLSFIPDTPPDEAPRPNVATEPRPDAPAPTRFRKTTQRAAPALKPVMVTICFPLTGDEQKDRRKLGRIRALLNEYPGRDQYRIRIVFPNGKRVTLDYPGQTTQYAGAVENELTKLVGANNIQLSDLPA